MVYVIQTILTAKEFLDKELAKYKTWKEFNHNQQSLSMIFAGNSQFQKVKKEKLKNLQSFFMFALHISIYCNLL